ncbi:MAG: porin [Desulfobacterales bacterium]|nr:porin [Desulfobacterales bacterium]
MLKNKILYFSIGLLLSTQQAMANDTDFEFAGFASFVYAKTISDSDEGELLGPTSDISRNGEARDFNKFGFRMSKDLGDGLSFTTQVVAYGYDDYEPDFDWAYLSYKFNPKVKVDFGRIRMPIFQYSDYLDTGFAYQWISPPYTVYNKSFLKSLEGAKITYLSDIGEWSSELSAYAGEASETIDINEARTDQLSFNMEDTTGIAWTVDNEIVTLRASYGNREIEAEDMGESIAGLTGSIADLGDTISVDLSSVIEDIWLDGNASFVSIGMMLDINKTFILTELIHTDYDTNILVDETNRYYITVGHRFPSNVTLSLTYGELDSENNKDIKENFDDLVNPYLGVSSALDTAIQGLSGALEAAEEGEELEEYTLSARWDFHSQAALKFEYMIQDHLLHDQTPEAYRFGVDLVF